MFQDKNINVAAKIALGLATLLASLVVPPVKAEAGLVHSLQDIENNRQLANDPKYKWAAAVKRQGSDGITYASGVLIAPDVYINSGHFTPINGSQVASHQEIIFGSNYNASTDRYQVARTERYPSFIRNDPSTVDLGVGWTSTFITGFNAPVTFGTLHVGQYGTMVDYGNIADPSTAELPSQGDRLAGTSLRINDFSNVYPSDKYGFLRFDTSDPLSTKGLNRSSGSPWFNSNGDLSYLTIAGTDGTWGGITVGLDLNTPELQAYLQPIIQDSWARYNASIAVPEPSSLALLGVAGVAFWRLRRKASLA